MAILLDKHARDVIARRQAAGRDATVVLKLSPVPHGGRRLAADWGPLPGDVRVRQNVDGVELVVDERIARYAYWRDVTISGWHLGPFDYLTVVGEPKVLLDMVRWERSRAS